MRGLFRSPFVPPGLSALQCGTTGPPATASRDPPAAPCRPSTAWPCSTICHLAGSSSFHLARVLSPWLLVSTSPTNLDEQFFFISLVGGLPYSSIFCQFWLFFVFKLLLSFFWLCEEAQCVYLRLHLGRKPCDLHFCGTVPVLVVCLVCFVFRFSD